MPPASRRASLKRQFRAKAARGPGQWRAALVNARSFGSASKARSPSFHVREFLVQQGFKKASNTGSLVQVLVRDNNVDQALKALKKKMQREGIFREMKLRGHYEKPSEKRAREKAEAVRRARKLARKKLQREGLLPVKAKPSPGAPR
jgi:small subunit ribosomal protein S21